MVSTWLPLPDLLGHQADDDRLPAEGLELLLAELAGHRPAWHDQAACAGADVALFFPERGQDDRPGKALCRACPVAAECLAVALAHDERSCPGTWGGTSARERRALRQEARSAA